MSSTYAKRGVRHTGEELTLGLNTGGRASNGTNNRLWSSKKDHLPSVILLRVCITHPNRQKGARRRPASERPYKMGPDVAEFLLILKKSTRTSYSLVKDQLTRLSNTIDFSIGSLRRFIPSNTDKDTVETVCLLKFDSDRHPWQLSRLPSVQPPLGDLWLSGGHFRVLGRVTVWRLLKLLLPLLSFSLPFTSVAIGR